MNPDSTQFLFSINQNIAKQHFITMFKTTPTIFFAIALLFSCSQPTKIASDFPGTFEGNGTPSELLKMKTTGIMDTTGVFVHHKITIIDQSTGKPVEEKGVGVSVLWLKPGTDSSIDSGITDIKGSFDKYIMPGTYDLEYRYSGCNPLKLKNLQLNSGEIKDIQVRLGIQGKAVRMYEVDVAGK